MMKYLVITDFGYELHDGGIPPENAINLTDNEYDELNSGDYVWWNGQITPVVHPVYPDPLLYHWTVNPDGSLNVIAYTPAELAANASAALAINAPVITASYNASLARQATRLQSKGKTFQAVQLLLKSKGIS